MADLAKQHPESTPATIFLRDYTPPAYLVESVELEFLLDETDTEVRSHLVCKRNPASDAPATLQLDGSHQQLLSIVLDGQPLGETEYRLDEEKLIIPEVPEAFDLDIVSRINPAANTALEGLYHSGSMLCTQCEAEGFRRISYFPDRPDVMARYRVTLRADKQRFPVLLSNGNLVARGEDGDQHWAVWEDPSLKPSYLFALVAGQLECIRDSFTTVSGREVALHLYVEAENVDKCEHAMASLKQAMRWDEQTYGREYDLDIYMIVAVNDFNMGAMENKGLNIFNASCVLASPQTASDADFYNIQSIIGHEYFHNWSGNRVTCRDWFQLSLKEGFTVFRDQEFSADLNSRAVKRIDDVNVLRAHQFAQDAGPMAHPVRPDRYMEISNFYTVTVYNKGAEVVRMIREIVGVEGFRKGTDLYFEHHDGQAVTTDDFVHAMEEANGVDLGQFRRWYDQAGTPELTITDDYDAQRQQYRLTIKQYCPPTPNQADKQPFHIPFAVGLLDEQGRDIPLCLEGESLEAGTTQVLQVTEAIQTFTFTGVSHRPVPSLGRGFSAPVKVHYNFDDVTLAFLLANDSDAFTRWDAGQTLALNTLRGLIDDIQTGRPLALGDDFVAAFAQALNDERLDPALIARILSLPGESYIADQMDVVDVDAIHQARQFVRRELASRLRDDLLQVYEAMQDQAAYRFNAADMARRSLKNTVLAYLMLLEDESLCQLGVAQFRQGHNMTDVIAALSCLNELAIPQRQQALDEFYRQWQHDPQVVEKWLALQAASSLPGTLEQVKALMSHPAFSLGNPNKVRSLIGRFAAGNPVHFHAADGSGYAFLADQVLALDSMNPQIAARLVQNFSRWRRHDENRQHRMREQLQRIVDKGELSRDVYEIAAKSLGEE